MIGWVKLHRKLLNWEWYNKSEYVHLFLHILIKANFEDKNWQGIEVKRGQLITSIGHLKAETGISDQTIRTILNKLKSTSELTIKSTNRFTIITVEKYSEYQSNEDKLTSELTSELTNNQQTTNKQLTTTKEVKNVKNDNKKICDDSDFENFWKLYDKKSDREKCMTRWKKIPQFEKENIFKVLEKYIASTPDKKFRKNPLTWLNGKCWNDEISSKLYNQEDDEEKRKIAEWAKTPMPKVEAVNQKPKKLMPNELRRLSADDLLQYDEDVRNGKYD